MSEAKHLNWKIRRKHGSWTEREHTDIRTTLLAQQVIEYGEERTGGTPKKLYRLR